MKTMKIIAVLVLSVACLATVGTSAADVKVNPFKASLVAVTAGEMPAKAADLVKHARARDWGNTTVNVVKAALEINPAAAPAVVGAIARTVPEMAVVAATTAAELQPKQASAIAKAAAAAAPGRAAKIVAALCRVVPSDFRSIASAVSDATPDANKEILKAVAVALPDTKASVDRVLMGYSGAAPVSQVIAQVTPVTAAPSASVAAAARIVQGPVVNPPFVPGTDAGTNVTSGTSGVVPEGADRDYAKP